MRVGHKQQLRETATGGRIISTAARLGRVLVAATLAALVAVAAQAGSRDQAKRMHDRIAGVPPPAAVLDAMTADITGGNPVNAALRATDSPSFYNVTLKNFVTPWTNREQTAFAPLNDYTATVIGMVRDDEPFNTVLSANILYVGNANLGLTPYSMTNNDHYQALDDQGIDLKQNLVKTTQSTVTGIPAAGVAGVLTTRAAAAAFFVAGTNRAMFRFTVLNHLCKELEEIKDTTLPPDMIRQDVSRSPGGDSRIFLNNCIGCHSGMDPMARAFAYYNFDATAGRMFYTPGQVQPKYLINSSNFKYGFVTPDDHWSNYWRHGQNRLLGWASGMPGTGTGAASLGDELAASDAFAECQVQKVFRNVCLRDPVDVNDRGQITSMVSSFKGNGYKMKRVFAEAAAYCKGD